MSRMKSDVVDCDTGRNRQSQNLRKLNTLTNGISATAILAPDEYNTASATYTREVGRTVWKLTYLRFLNNTHISNSIVDNKRN